MKDIRVGETWLSVDISTSRRVTGAEVDGDNFPVVGYWNLDDKVFGSACGLEIDTCFHRRTHDSDGNPVEQKPERKKIRRAIFEEFHDEIIDDLNADMVKEIKELKEQLARAYDSRYP